VRSVSEAWLSSDLGAAIVKLPFQEGDAFKKGDTLIAFDCASFQSQLKAAKAKLAGEATMLKNNKQLKDHNAGGQFDVDIAKAKVDEAQAAIEQIEVTLARCVIAAPFDGRMADLGVHLHEVPERNARIMHILDTATLEVDMILPSAWMKWMEPGVAFELAVDETGAVAQAKVIRIAAAVDPVSQTIKVIGRLGGDAAHILPGMSGAVIFRPPNG
jgi:membrane fusion protein, multidrug efflux system